MKNTEGDADQGFQEQEHTADWEIKVWAPDLSDLFKQSATGMYALQGIRLKKTPRIERSLTLSGIDNETLLVEFLEELLFLAESEDVAFDDFEIAFWDGSLHATLKGAPIAKVAKEIKAVTYHGLSIKTTAHGLEVGIVFDV